MNIQKTLFIVCCFLSLLQRVHAQDTIVKRNGEKVLAKVTEVGETIRYKRIDLPDGPTYSVSKSEVSMILYKGGNRDLFDISPVPVTTPAPTIVMAPEERHLIVDGRRYEYGRRRISESRMLNIAKDHRSDTNILNEIELTRSSKRGQYITGFVGDGCFVVGGYSALFALIAGTGTGSSQPTFTVVAIVGVVGGIAFEVASAYFKSERIRHAHRVVDLYNKTILN